MSSQPSHSSLLTSDSSPNTQSFDQIPHSPLQWLWHPYLPLGKITLMLGDPDSGKSPPLPPPRRRTLPRLRPLLRPNSLF